MGVVQMDLEALSTGVFMFLSSACLAGWAEGLLCGGTSPRDLGVRSWLGGSGAAPTLLGETLMGCCARSRSFLSEEL